MTQSDKILDLFSKTCFKSGHSCVYLKYFYKKVPFFKIAQKVVQVFVVSLRKLGTKIFQNVPIWSHCK